MHKVKSKAATQERIVDALCRFVHVGACTHRGRTGVEKLRALSEHDADVGDGAARSEVSVVLRRPPEVVNAYLLPTAIFTKTVLRTDEVVVRGHAAGKGFIQPHLRFGRIL